MKSSIFEINRSEPDQLTGYQPGIQIAGCGKRPGRPPQPELKRLPGGHAAMGAGLMLRCLRAGGLGLWPIRKKFSKSYTA
jgi:hypothetical protein